MKHVVSVSSDGSRRARTRWFLAIVLAMCLAAFHVFMLADGFEILVVVLLGVFDLVVFLMFVLAVRATLHNRRYGQLELVLDPSPGSLGGHVGGEVELPILPSDDDEFRVTLSCERRTEYFDGEDTQVTWRTLWQRGTAPEVEALPDRVCLRFAFDVSEKLPPTGVDDDSTIHWRVRLTGDMASSVDLDARFDVPVERSVPPRYSQGFEATTGGSTSQSLPKLVQDLSPRVVLAEFADDELRLRFSPDRTRGLSLGLFGVSVLLLVLAGFLQWRHEPGTIQMLPMAFLAVLVAGMAILVLGASLFLGQNDLKVCLKPDWLTVERRRFGRSFRQTFHRRQIASLRVGSLRLTESLDTRYGIYWLRARLKAGGGITLADGLRGGATLDPIVKIYEDWFGEIAEYV